MTLSFLPHKYNQQQLAKVATGIKACFSLLDIPMPTEWTRLVLSMLEEHAGWDSINTWYA